MTAPVTMTVRSEADAIGLHQLLGTRQGRESLAVYLAQTMGVAGMDEYIGDTVALLAPHLTAEDQWLALHDLVDARRQQADAGDDESELAAACIAVDDAIARLAGGAR